MSNNQMNAEQKVVATLGQLGAEVVWLGASGVDSVYFTREGITDADLKYLKGLTSLTKLKLNRSLITDAGLKHLQSLTSLVQLHLAGIFGRWFCVRLRHLSPHLGCNVP